MKTLLDLLGWNPLEPMIAYGGGGGGGSSSYSSSGNRADVQAFLDSQAPYRHEGSRMPAGGRSAAPVSSGSSGRSEAEIQKDINKALSDSGGEWTSELNDLVSEREVARSSGSSSSGSGSSSSSGSSDAGFLDDGGTLERFFDGIGLDVDGDAADGVSGGVANLGDTDGDGVGEFAFTDNASDGDRSNVASGNVGLAGTITNVSGNITDTPVDTGSSDQGPSGPTFSEAFAAARAAQGPGGVFTWQGQRYSTNTAEEEAAAADEAYAIASLPGRDLDADLGIGMSEDTVTAEEIAGDEVQAPGTVTLETSGGGSVTIGVDDPRVDQIIDGTLTADDLVGVGVVPEPDQGPGLAVGDPMTPQLAVELGISYFEGDTLQSSDIEALRDLGFDVDESTITGTLEGTVGLGDVAFTGGQSDVASVIEANASDAPTISASRLSDLESYVSDLRDIQGSYTVEDLDGAGFTADEIAAYEQLVAPGKLSTEDLAEIQDQYGDLTMAQYNALEETFGPYLGTYVRGSAALTTELAGNLLVAVGDIPGIKYENGKVGFDPQDNALTQTGESVVQTGKELQDEFVELLEIRYPDDYEAFNTPIVDPQTGRINKDALQAKAMYSALPTLAGLAGLPFGAIPAVVTGGLMTAAEIGTESRNEAYETALEQGFDVDEAEMIGRSANLLGSTLGVPVGAVSNLFLGKLITPGVGANQIAKFTGSMLLAAVDEGIIEQSTIKTSVNSMFEGTQGFGELDIPLIGTLDVSGGLSMDEFVLGALTGGAISAVSYAKAKAAGMSDQQIAQQIEGTPEGETVTLTDSSGNVVAEGTVPVSDIMFSGNPVEMRTDADGNSVIVDTVTGNSAVMPAGTTFEAGETTGTETTVNDLTASEILQGDNITIGQDSEGNITLTDNDTGLTTNVEGNLFYDAFGNSYTSAESASAADAGYGLTGDETKVGDLQQQEDNVIGGEGADVTVSVTSEGVTLTNEDTGMTVVVPSGNTASIVDIVDAIQNNDTSTVETLGGTVSDIGTTAPSVEDITAGVLAALPESASPEQVTSAINEAISGLENLSSADVQQIVAEALGSFETLSEQDVTEIVEGVVAAQDVLTEQDVSGIVDAALQAGLGSLEDTLNTRIGELEAAGVDRAAAVDQALNEVASQVGETKESLLQTLGETEESILASVTEKVSAVEASLTQRIAELEASGVDRATAVDQALSELSTNLGTTEQELLAQVGKTEQSLLSEIGSVEQRLFARTQELEESGIERDQALKLALGEVATNLGTTEESLLNEIGQTEQSLLGEIGKVQSGLTQQIGAVEQTLIERTQELEQSGLARDEALQVALGEVAANLGTTEQALLNEIGQTQQSLTQQIENVQTELSTELGVTNTQLAEIVSLMEEERQKEEEYLASLEGVPELDRTPDYIPSVAPQVGNIITEDGTRPVVAPYYQPQQAGVFSVYRPQPGVQQTPQGPVFQTPQSYLAPTSAPQYGYGYVAPNADIEYLRNLARVQGTGAERLASERLMSDE